jgi:predicted phage terminase large subunit-like protein
MNETQEIKQTKPDISNRTYIDALLKTDLTNFDNLQKLFGMIRIYERENFQEAHKLNKLVKKHSSIGSAGDVDIAKFYNLNKLAYLFDAPHEFESYLIYVEWDREPKRRFYLPRRKVLKQLVDALQDLEDDKIDLLTISLPPGIGKTTLGCFFLSWTMGRHPDEPNLASAHGDKLTRGFYDQVRAIITDSEYLYIDVFPTVKVESFNSHDETINLNSGKRFKTLTCRSIGGGLTGATRCERYLYCDDLVSGIEEALNRDRLDKLWAQYTNDLKSRKKKNCKEIHIATRWSVWDIIGRLETQYDSDARAKFITVSALNEADESNFNYLYSVGFDEKYFKDMRENLDDVSWRCLYMNEPIEREGLLFPEENLLYYNGVLPPIEPDRIVTFCDVAWGGGDYLSMPIGYQYGKDLYVVDVVFNNNNKEITRPIVIGKLLQHKPHQVRFEANNGGDEYADAVDKELKDRHSCRLNISSRKAPGNATKISRIIQASPDITKCYFLDKGHRHKEYQTFMKNMTSYMTAAKNKNDDAPDSMAGLVALVFSNFGQVRIMDRPF